MPENNVVEVNQLTKKYPGITALKKINVKFSERKITGLIGPNGSGKSTLLRSIAGLTRPSAGKIKILGKKLTRDLKEKIAFLPEINYFYESMSIKEVIDLSGSQFSNFDSEKALDLIDFMDLNIDSKIENLSKGMVGRVKLALTMARKVPLIIMDEALAGFYHKSESRILESLISEYNAEEQSVILSTHEVLEAERFFDNVIFLENGKIKLKGNADDLRSEYNKSIQDLAKEVLE